MILKIVKAMRAKNQTGQSTRTPENVVSVPL